MLLQGLYRHIMTPFKVVDESDLGVVTFESFCGRRLLRLMNLIETSISSCVVLSIECISRLGAKVDEVDLFSVAKRYRHRSADPNADGVCLQKLYLTSKLLNAHVIRRRLRSRASGHYEIASEVGRVVQQVDGKRWLMSLAFDASAACCNWDCRPGHGWSRIRVPCAGSGIRACGAAISGTVEVSMTAAVAYR
jgi:hypothetical protein